MPIIQMFMQNRLSERRAQADDVRARDNRREAGLDQMAFSTLEPISSGKLNPKDLPPELAARLPFDPSIMRPNDAILMNPEREQIRTATTQVDVPTIESLLGSANAKGVDTDPTFQLGDASPLPYDFQMNGTLPAYTRGQQLPPQVQALIDARDSQLANIDRSQELEMDRGFATAQGNAYNAGQGAHKANNEQFPIELAQRLQTGQQDQGLHLDTLTKETPILTERAGLVTGAQEDAQLDPSRVDARVEMASRIAAVQAEAQNMFTTPSEGERRAASQGSLFARALSDADSILGKGVGASVGLIQVVSTPALSALSEAIPGMQYSEDEKLLGQAMLNAGTIATYIISGQQTRAEEFPRMAMMLFPMKTDPEPVKQQKQATRQAFFSAIQLSAGRSKSELGILLGQMAAGGKINPDFFKAVTLDPEVAAGLEIGLNPGGIQ